MAKRSFKRSRELVHDLYKLGDAQCLKNVAWQEHVVEYEKITHNHFFHSIDAKGSPQNTSAHTAGHFHVLEITKPATDTDPAQYKCSPPMKWARKRNRSGGWEKVLIPYNADDTHTHDVKYINSEKFTPAKVNTEAVALEAQMAARAVPVAGIIG